MPNPLIIKKVLATSGNKYGAYTSAFYTKVLAEGGTLTPTELTALTVFENAVGSDLSEFDRLWIHGLSNQIAARISFVNPNSTLITEVNSPTWTAYQGYAALGPASHLNLNYNPFTDGVKYALDSMSIFSYCITDVAQASHTMMGVYSAYLAAIYPKLNGFSNKVLSYQNNTSLNYIQSASADISTKGLYFISRTNSTTVNQYKNGVLIGSSSLASEGVPLDNFYALGINLNGVINNSFAGKLAVNGMGSGAINQLNFYNAIQALGTTLGWAV